MKATLTLLLLYTCTSSLAQIRNDSLEYRIRPDSARTGSLYLSVNNFNFLRNYEFYNRFQDGYTLYGTQLEPQLIYYPDARLAIMAGIHVRKDFGDRGISATYPLFSLKYSANGLTLIAGTLEGTIHHRMAEPLLDVEKRITDPIEYGTQIVINRTGLFLDAFVNWKQMIYKPSPIQEQIIAGVSSAIRLAGSERLSISMPLQALVFHQGGQIDTLSQPLQTVVNTVAGLRIQSQSQGFIRSAEAEASFLSYNEVSPVKIRPYSSGTGLLLHAGASASLGSLSANYWKGNGFIATSGMPVYQSLSQQINNVGYTQKCRELLFLRYAYQKKLTPHLLLDFRVEPVFDFNTPGAKMDFYHSLFLVYRQEFGLKR